MRDDYKISGETRSLEIQIEKTIADTLETMAKHTKHTASELANTALKRFISQHKDFLPPPPRKT